MAKKKTDYSIKVAAQAFYLEEQSAPDSDRYVFAYTVLIQNQGNIAAKLLSRHWIITDANGKIEEVRGEGVVGEQPHLRPGEGFQYTSGAILETSVGSMKGSYQMLADDGRVFDTDIPPFVLSIPRTLH
ncbi:MAG: Co2+/Mg2+ efflux protein ApaG [Candidatus Competibacteraceae bacterium]|uniref:Protein ApaG n=1 Tax=Candidatus Contendobacter odensis Run_B_J11 TaxID=1400861 RepID=A0A7U7GEW8_9GAMM|nr:Co2+/Mg2+ efflux protein ApaG [Candidatus Contendobacter odensis]MBK8535069.1 Co2+/Mg2+ efflux protein ApaG [Candidatus Competibacteraceae bacterium]MBK8753286.1 Co2+/Mg2+ efflux protein ApaG [Candidatus Competibacteraceae bacterium]CDH46830.1 Protein ApaG [Candidatus Contendobacter odensis Run_B_J11]